MLPASPRARRRAISAIALAAIAGSVAAVFALIPSHAPSAPGPVGNEGPAQLASNTPKVRLTKADRRAIDAVLDRFLPAAMERKDPAAGWALAGPELKSGSTLAQWRRGTSAVPYYDARETTFHDWQTIDVGPRYVIFNLLLHPGKGSQLAPYVFSGEVVKEDGRWLVNRLYTIAIMNRPSKTKQMPEVGPADFNAPSSSATAPTDRARAKTTRIVPVLGLLALILLVPLALGLIALHRARSWRRRVRSSGRQEIPALPSRYRP
jgi:hypothetical protein